MFVIYNNIKIYMRNMSILDSLFPICEGWNLKHIKLYNVEPRLVWGYAFVSSCLKIILTKGN